MLIIFSMKQKKNYIWLVDVRPPQKKKKTRKQEKKNPANFNC